MKRLFFAALLATVAIGGAFAKSSLVSVFDANGNPVNCSVGAIECTDQQYYSDQAATQPIPQSELEGTFRN